MHGYTSTLAGVPGTPELIIILVVVLLLFGRRLPGVARSLGQGISSFKKGLQDPLDEDSDGDDPSSLPESKARAEKAESRSD